MWSLANQHGVNFVLISGLFFSTPGLARSDRVELPRGENIADDTARIQAAVDAAGPGATVYIPAGVYLIDTTYRGEQATFGGIKLHSNMTLALDKNAVFQAISTDRSQYAIVRAWGVNNLTIKGGTFRGERQTHRGVGGEHGFGIDVRNSKNVRLQDLTCRDCWGDGIYLGADGRNNFDIRVERVICDNNRRQGMSVVGCDGLRVIDSTFKNTNGTLPEAGIDLEPDEGAQKNISISTCTFQNNAYGVICTHTGKVKISNCQFTENKTAVMANGGAHALVDVEIAHCEFLEQYLSGISLRDHVDLDIYENRFLELKTNINGFITFDGDAAVRRLALKNNTFVNSRQACNFRFIKPDYNTKMKIENNTFFISGSPITDNIYGHRGSIFSNNTYQLSDKFNNKNSPVYLVYFAGITINNCRFLNASRMMAQIGHFSNLTVEACVFSPYFSFQSRDYKIQTGNYSD